MTSDLYLHICALKSCQLVQPKMSYFTLIECNVAKYKFGFK
jgi:hypothetical protein